MLCVLEHREVRVCPKRTMCLCKENTNGSRNVCEEGPRTRCYQIVHPKNKTFYYLLNLFFFFFFTPPPPPPPPPAPPPPLQALLNLSLSAIWLQTGKWNLNK